MPDALLPLGDERVVSLITFRKTGVAVSSPVWVVRDGDPLFSRGRSNRLILRITTA